MKLKDKDIREPLFAYLEELYGKIRILEEKRTGRSRADVVMITEGGIYGIEIKSDADSYTRLQSQVADYDRYYDFNIAAVGSSHGNHIEEHVPDHWGIITIENTPQGPDFYYLRKPKINPHMDPRYKFSLLWRPEIARLQERNGLPKYAGKSKMVVSDMVLDRVSPEILWPQVYETLFERDYTKIQDEINAYRVKNGQKPRRKRKYRRKRKGSL